MYEKKVIALASAEKVRWMGEEALKRWDGRKRFHHFFFDLLGILERRKK